VAGFFTRPTCVLVCAGLLAGGCHSSPGLNFPTAPAPSPTAEPPANRTHTLSGVVTAGGRPAPGARVTVLEMATEPSATTDGDGYYGIPGLPTSSFWNRTLVRFSQRGYFTEFKRPNIRQDTRLDVMLDPLVVVAAGEIVRGTVKAGDGICAGKDYEEDACLRFALVSPIAGTLEVTLTSHELVALDVVTSEGEAFAEFKGSSKRVSLPTRAGGTYEIRVVTFGGHPEEFQLTTSVR